MRGVRFPSLPPDRRWHRRLVLATAVAVGLGWLPYLAYGRSSLGRLAELRAELAELGAKNQALREENQRLRSEIQLHDEDPLGAVERTAREHLGLVKPGELVFRVRERGDRP